MLVNDQLDALFLNVFILYLYRFRATSAHHQEDPNYVEMHGHQNIKSPIRLQRTPGKFHFTIQT